MLVLKYPGLSRAKILIKMVGTKKESVYRKKRKVKDLVDQKEKQTRQRKLQRKRANRSRDLHEPTPQQLHLGQVDLLDQTRQRKMTNNLVPLKKG